MTHLTKTNKNVCYCGKIFRSKAELLKHIYDDEASKMYACICRARFDSWGEIKEHVKECIAKECECPVCGEKQFCLCTEPRWFEDDTDSSSSLYDADDLIFEY